MDRPRASTVTGPSAVSLFSLAGALLLSGCITQANVAPTVNGLPVSSVRNVDAPKRDPKPATSVAFGDLCASTANEPGRTAQDRDQRREQARSAYLQALKDDPNYLQAHAGLARVYEDMADHDRAVSEYQKALQISPKEAELWFQLGMSQARHKEWQPALQNMQKAQELDPNNRRYADMLGFCLARTGNYDASIACFRKVMSEAQAHYNLARMLHHDGQEAMCRQHLETAVRLQPDFEAARRMFAEITAVPAAPAATGMAAGAMPAPAAPPAIPSNLPPAPANGAAGWN
jgi:tetratricopeptide (TPR) repeat protein